VLFRSLASKAVVTCTDSGGPLEFIVDGQNGLIAKPTPDALAAVFDRLWDNKDLALRFGEAGRVRYQSLDLSWKKVVDKLLS